MVRGEYADLAELREKLLGYRLDAVSRLGGIPLDRLIEIESDEAEPSIYEIEVLARIYGLDSAALVERPIRLDRGDSIEVLALRDEFREIQDAVKVKVVEVANAVRDLTWLRGQLGQPVRKGTLAAKLRHVPRNPALAPWAQGKKIAEWLRRESGLRTGSLPSVRDFLSSVFPEIAVLYSRLGDTGIAGLAFADEIRDQTLVLNLEGKNENPCVRRFSLAHELCHLLVDKSQREPLASLSGFLSDQRLEMEQRANGFASRLLCPESVVRKLAKGHGVEKALRTLCNDYGLHYDAARLYLRNVGEDELPPKFDATGWSLASRWAEAEEPVGIERFPIEAVPHARRTVIAHLAASLYSAGGIPRDRFASLLDLTPVEPVERVLDYFDLDLPDQ